MSVLGVRWRVVGLGCCLEGSEKSELELENREEERREE